MFVGTSSILAGAALAAVYRCTGRSYDKTSLVHDVLYLEQILTTGMRDCMSIFEVCDVGYLKVKMLA